MSLAKRIPVNRIIKSSEFDPSKVNSIGDIALLLLNKTIKFSDTVRAACLIPSLYQTNQILEDPDQVYQASGFGSS